MIALWLVLAGVSAAAEPATLSADAPVRPEQVHTAGKIVDRVAASVNDDIITLSEIYDFGGPYIEEQVEADPTARPRAEREVLDRLIERMLVDQEITALQLSITEQELDRTIDDIARRNGLDWNSLRREVERSGMTWDSYRTQLQGDLQQMKFAQAILRPRVNITEDEVQDAYNRMGQRAPQLIRLQALFLAFPAEAATDPAAREALLARAAAIRQQAVGMTTEQFAALSREEDEAGFGAQGGEMGQFGKGELLPALDAAVSGLGSGAVSEVVVLEQGVFVLRVVDFAAATRDLEEVREQLMEQLFESRMVEEQSRWVEQARARASIRLLLP